MTLEHPPGTPRPVRLDAGRFALWVFLATEVMFFTALIASYLVLRAGAVARDGIPWPRAQEVHVDQHIRSHCQQRLRHGCLQIAG